MNEAARRLGASDVVGSDQEALKDMPSEKPANWRAQDSKGVSNAQRSLAALAELGIKLSMQFERTNSLQDLKNAIRCQRLAILLPGASESPMRPMLFMSLGSFYIFRYERLRMLSDLNKAIDHQCQALKIIPSEHKDKSRWLADLSDAYLGRFEHLGNPTDINNAINFLTQVVPLTAGGHAERPRYLDKLGYLHGRRFQCLGELLDVNQAIELHQEAVLITPDGHADKSARISNLGTSYGRRFERSGEPTDINKAIESQGRAVLLMPDNHREKPICVNTLGISYLRRFERIGELADIDKAIEWLHRAISLTAEDDREKSGRLNNLGLSYMRRFERLAELTDLEKAISHQSRAVLLAPDNHEDKPGWLSNLGSSYMRRFESLGKLEDLNAAIQYQSQAVLLAPNGHPYKYVCLMNLGSSCGHRYRRLGNLADIEKSIDCAHLALQLIPNEHAYKSICLENLGSSYTSRFQRLGELEDINKAIHYQNQALQLIPNGHADKPGWLSNLGKSYINRFKRLDKSADLEAASSLFEMAAQSLTGHPRIKFDAALEWATCLSLTSVSPLVAYRKAMELLPQLVWLGSTIDQRYTLLADIGDVAMKVASWAISVENYNSALEWLEQGRSIVWNQILQLRTPLDNLFAVNPDLAERLKRVGRELENAGSRTINALPTSPDESNLEQEAQYHRHLATQWDQLLDQVRNIEGFSDFMRPHKAKNLVPAAKDGPVIVINVDSGRCDALILTPNDNKIAHVPLKDFSRNKAIEARGQLASFIEQHGLRSRGLVWGRSKGTPIPEKLFKGMLATLWSDVVKPVLDFLGNTHGSPVDRLQHVTWCTTGPLSFLPLHAAGCYDGSQPNAIDLIASSYTPTLGALLASSPPVLNPNSGVLAVGLEYKNSPAYLPNTMQELAAIKHYTNSTRYLQLEDNNATVDAVLNAMDEHSWVHLACHASQHKEDPSQSAFQLYDGNLMLSTITKREFKNKGLAFLSACQTATGDEKLPDEAVHLAAGMLMAGYPSVIATMWAIGDKDAPEVARHVYAELLKDGEMDYTKAARALHQAVAGLRKNVGVNSFERWVPFIHIGV